VFQVAVDDSLIVRGLQGVGELPGDAQAFVDRNWATVDPVGERLTIDELHDQGTDAVNLLEPVDLRCSNGSIRRASLPRDRSGRGARAGRDENGKHE